MVDTLFFLGDFLHDLILPPGGIKSEFIMREILIGRKSKSKVQVKRIKCSFRLDYRRKSLGTKIRLF